MPIRSYFWPLLFFVPFNLKSVMLRIGHFSSIDRRPHNWRGLTVESHSFPQQLWIKSKFGKRRLTRTFDKRPLREHRSQHPLDAGLIHRPEVTPVERFGAVVGHQQHLCRAKCVSGFAKMQGLSLRVGSAWRTVGDRFPVHTDTLPCDGYLVAGNADDFPEQDGVFIPSVTFKIPYPLWPFS